MIINLKSTIDIFRLPLQLFPPAGSEGSILKPRKNIILKNILILIVLIISILPPANSQSNNQKRKPNSSTWVDQNGILRWSADNTELNLFGVNYTTPFAHSYREHGHLNIDREKAIDADVYHFARLGFDAFRVHVWDCEISDTLGNLLDNDHLRLFDYLLKRLKERNIKILITPIAYWGNGYPEPDEKTPGFSTKYGKANCLVNPAAIKAQENYLSQFVNHVNPFTGLKYKDDPDIIAFEVCNEPHHEGIPAEVTDFINRMVKAIRVTGCEKPVIYNVSHNIYLGDAYFNADIQGGTFQWYPTGLVRGHELPGNFLPNVADYIIPYECNKRFRSMTRVVYEYDAADIGRSYIYPYMAKSFREAGFQFATQFAYDPLYMAYANTDYQTHYMNLVYAPQKVMSLKIAGEVFHKLPTYAKSGEYPADTSFDCFRVRYKSDLSEMVSDEKFMYTNNTLSVPPRPETLKQIAGYGSSSVVSYEGSGDYFLDQLENGVWRLEVFPDAVWVRDPFERASPARQVSVITWNEWPMAINLPDLGKDFNIQGLNSGNYKNLRAVESKFPVTPGTYLLTSDGNETRWKSTDRWGNILIGEFVAPPPSPKKTYLIHVPYEEVTDGTPVKIKATVVGADNIDTVQLIIRGRFRQSAPILMNRVWGYFYEAVLPGAQVHEGILRYNIIVKHNGKSITFPGDIDGNPADWDYYDQNAYITRIVPQVRDSRESRDSRRRPLSLIDPATDGEKIFGNTRIAIFPSMHAGESVIRMTTENMNDKNPVSAFRYFFLNKIKGRINEVDSFNRLVISGCTRTGKSCTVQVSIIMNDGSAFGTLVTLDQEEKLHEIFIKDLLPVPSINLPNSYPDFQPLSLKNIFNRRFNIINAESIQVSMGPGIFKDAESSNYDIAIGRIFLDN